MHSFFTRAGAALSQYKIKDGAGEVAGQRLRTILDRQKKETAEGVLARLSGSKPEEATEPLYDSSAYNSIGNGTEF
jgi:fructose-1-phosphate kinase PfkB-like protein